MSASYDSTRPTDMDHVRFLIRDTDITDPTFSDEEILAQIADEDATGSALKYYAAATLLSVLVASAATARGAGNVLEKRIGKLLLRWGIDRDTADTLKNVISDFRRKGGYKLATSSKVFRVIGPGNRNVGY